jgi:hypothetical protein
MELAEVTRTQDADEQRAQAEPKDVACRPRMESANVGMKKPNTELLGT